MTGWALRPEKGALGPSTSRDEAVAAARLTRGKVELVRLSDMHPEVLFLAGVLWEIRP